MKVRMILKVLATAATLSASTAASAADPPQAFPDLELVGRDGGSVRISQLKGNVVFVNFWATWCGPCRMELPLLQDLYNRYSDRNFAVLAVSVDEDHDRVGPFLKKNNLSLPIYYANPYDVAALTQRGIPTTFIIDPSGNVEKGFIGFEPNIENEWIEHINKFLKKKKSKS